MKRKETRIEVRRGDITGLEVGAIVNAANDRLAPGGGVCGAIHRAAGPKLAEACAKIGHCPTGEARITPGFELKARHVIHAVGPVWQGGEADEAELLASCYGKALALARKQGLSSIAFPAISTGIYGYPLAAATAIAVATVKAEQAAHGRPELVVFCVFDERAEDAYRQALAA